MAVSRSFYLCVILGFGIPKAFSFFKSKVCMDKLGCFSRGRPFYDMVERPLSLLPEDKDKIDTQFLQILANDGTVPAISIGSDFGNYDDFDNLSDSVSSVYNSSSSVINSNSSIFDIDSNNIKPKIKTMFLIPGYMSEMFGYWIPPAVQTLLTTEPHNVFVVDWHKGDGAPYEQAVANTRVVGAELALFIQRLKKNIGLPYESVHLIGHSLGAHIAGYAGKRLNKIGRITGLDPAGPYFTNVDPRVRLDRSDANFVDVIHTNAASSKLEGFGIINSIGHLDFWPNGGQSQPGCSIFDYEGYYDPVCQHDRAIHLFISTINNHDCVLKGVECENMTNFVEGKCENNKTYVLGINADDAYKYIDDSKSKNIYLHTKEYPPYCKS